MKAKQTKHTPKEMAESLVFPGTPIKKKKKGIIDEFRAVRKDLTENQTPKSKLISQLLQLKFLMEDYIKKPDHNEAMHFGYFLKEYITRQSKKNNEFAEEIDISPTEISHVIKKRRKPTDKLIIRLQIHSNNNFPAAFWYKIMEKDRENELQTNKQIIESEKKHVKEKLKFSF